LRHLTDSGNQYRGGARWRLSLPLGDLEGQPRQVQKCGVRETVLAHFTAEPKRLQWFLER